jgi:hypothetical protein
MGKCNCGGGKLSVQTVATASARSHPMVADQPACDTPKPDKLENVSQVLFPGNKKTARFKWVTASTGHDVLEVEYRGKIRWIPVLTQKP